VVDLLRSIRGVREAFAAATAAEAMPALSAAGRSIVLAYLFPGLGDALLLAPVVKALLVRAQVAPPVGLLLRPLAAKALALAELPVRIHVHPESMVEPETDAPRSARAEKTARAERRTLVAELADIGYAIGVDLTHRRGLDARGLLAEAGIALRVGWLTEGETRQSAGLAAGLVDRRPQAAGHWSEVLAEPLRCFGRGAGEPDHSVRWRVPAAARARAEKRFGTAPRLLLVPGSKFPDKRWPADRFVAIARWAREHRGASVAMVGAPWERPLLSEIARAIGARVPIYTGEDLGTLAAWIAAADAVLANDTGPMHLAFALGVPTVALFLKMRPETWGPAEKSDRAVVLVPPSPARESPGDRERWIASVASHLDRLLP
jgi:ADP-heptose:LPS heptosyltransferase